MSFKNASIIPPLKRDIFVETFQLQDIYKETNYERDKIEGVLEKETFSCITSTVPV